eukprot:2079011-Rhodomonas_salina.1
MSRVDNVDAGCTRNRTHQHKECDHQEQECVCVLCTEIGQHCIDHGLDALGNQSKQCSEIQQQAEQ